MCKNKLLLSETCPGDRLQYALRDQIVTFHCYWSFNSKTADAAKHFSVAIQFISPQTFLVFLQINICNTRTVSGKFSKKNEQV